MHISTLWSKPVQLLVYVMVLYLVLMFSCNSWVNIIANSFVCDKYDDMSFS